MFKIKKFLAYLMANTFSKWVFLYAGAGGLWAFSIVALAESNLPAFKGMEDTPPPWHASGGHSSDIPSPSQRMSEEPAAVLGREGAERELGLQTAIETALQDNPGLAEMRTRAEAMAAIPSQVGTLPDPVISFNALNLPVDTFDRSQEAMTQLQVGISQEFPFPGKLGLRQSAAEYEAAAARHDVREMRLLLTRDVKQTWWNLFYLDQALETVKRNQELMRQFVEIAQTKYRVGQGLQQDVLLAQVELSKLLDLEVRLTALRRTGEARLNALLNWPTDSKLRLPRGVETELQPLAPEETWQRQAEKNRPLLAAEEQRVEAARERLDLAQKDYFPDFKLGAAYGFRSGDDPLRREPRADFATFMLSMKVPLYFGRKQAKAVDQRSSEVLQQIFAFQDRRQQVRREISTALADYRQAREQFLLFKTGIIPQARQTVASMLAGFQVNKVDFLNLVSAQITLYNFETEYWKVLAEAYQALAALSAAIGEEQIR
ncbi:outer membrane efflux protein [Nitrosococcus halophilus Nc 4]|uniref:Outer membrane efflux protein n=1 Tax=Nitrosococcus halophilus (strain Nc4) TaxID=472759 RepID=D5C2F6_NITHN|nr:TolC family protein [Nitrosococcus halophilus]ADE14815.1 outer membrane efflux protein [Nitrosococcus halophilus Nc 4]